MLSEKPISEAAGTARAFTLIELVVIVAVLAVLALCLLPALARTSSHTRAFGCLNNHCQLARAWRIYADDNSDRVPGVIHGTTTMANNPNAPWVQGWLDWSTSNDNTNTVLLTDPRYASLARYFGNDARILQCPADQFVSTIQRARGWSRRVRSVSANIYVGGVNAESGPTDPSFAVVKKYAELTNPKPSDTWLFIDDHPDSMNDPAFFSPQTQWIDMPANLHDGGAGVAFADGSAEIHRWQASVLNARVTFAPSFPFSVPSNNPDGAWLRGRTPRKPGAN